ncbi:MAG TPA: MFS transporter [Thermomicrobiales bacterium]|mgnify:CR=1 FL=1|nr:MFS transporter [Thermomicrobiales bacterium]
MPVAEGRTDPKPQTQSPPARGPIRFDAFAYRNFTIFWFSLVVTNTGTWMASVAEGWLITDLEPERKSLYLGFIAMSFAIPMLVLPPIGGVLADRLPRLTGIKLTQTAFLIVNSAVAALALTGHLNVHGLIAAAFAAALVLAFDSPIRHAMVPDLVPREHLTSAVSLNSVAFSGAGLIGPAVGGLLIPLIGTSGVFLINAISSLSVLIALKFLHDLPESAKVRSDHRGDDPRAALNRAIHYIRDTPLISMLFLAALVAGVFARSYSIMLPVLSRDIYQVGSTGNGILISAAGLGALLGGLTVSAIANRLEKRGRLILLLVATQGIVLGSLALHHTFLIGVLSMLIMGAVGAAAVALITAIVQEEVEPQLRGRVMGFFLLTFISFPSVGSFLLGLLADRTSIQWSFALFAVIVVSLMAAITVRAPTLRRAA